MIGTVSKVQYPYITSAPDIAGGALIIEGTRITVRCIASYYQMGMTVDEILMTLPHLRPSQVHSALAYYFDHTEQMMEEMENSWDEKHWIEQVIKNPDNEGKADENKIVDR